ALFFLDLDRFKSVNDTAGHACGDTLLQSAAARLTDCIGPGDVIARLGGDEFVILIEQRVEGKRIAQLAERLLAAMREPFDTVNGRYYLGVSIGVALDSYKRVTCRDPLRSAGSRVTSGQRNSLIKKQAYSGKVCACQNTCCRVRIALRTTRGELEMQID
ncbi:diguanylate cyclase, partial [Clostridium sporogenes]|uniref:diguanylate cyclase domain-containing protein n=1 Tax=Clostridium sporogenes TaxID=1509 RepID=UPI001C608E09